MSGLMDVAQAASNAVASNVYGPVDLLAAALRKAGVPVPEDPFLGSEWLRKRGLIRDVPQGVEQVAGETLGLLAPAMLASKASQIASGLLKARENAAAPNVVNAGMRGGQRGIFIGPGAATWDSEAAAKAAQMEKAGAPARQIWQDTGTFRSADGKWRQEISDEAAKFNPARQGEQIVERSVATGAGNLDLGPTVGKGVEALLHHPELQRAYGSRIASSTTIGNKNTLLGDGVQGLYDPASNRVTINAPVYDPSQGRSTVLHELQHAIQQREGWATGGTPIAIRKTVGDARAQQLAPVAGGRSAYESVSNKLGDLYQAQYLKKLEAIGSKASPKPSEITNMSAWYEYSDKLRAELGAMPKQAGSARDAWIRDAANFMRNQEARKIYGIEWKPEFRLSADELNKQVASLKRQADKFTAAAQEAARVESRFKKLEGLSDHELYQRLAGEAEARATQSRMNMTPAERRAAFPFDSYDVPVDQLIVR